MSAVWKGILEDKESYSFWITILLYALFFMFCTNRNRLFVVIDLPVPLQVIFPEDGEIRDLFPGHGIRIPQGHRAGRRHLPAVRYKMKGDPALALRADFRIIKA